MARITDMNFLLVSLYFYFYFKYLEKIIGISYIRARFSSSTFYFYLSHLKEIISNFTYKIKVI